MPAGLLRRSNDYEYAAHFVAALLLISYSARSSFKLAGPSQICNARSLKIRCLSVILVLGSLKTFANSPALQLVCFDKVPSLVCSGVGASVGAELFIARFFVDSKAAVVWSVCRLSLVRFCVCPFSF